MSKRFFRPLANLQQVHIIVFENGAGWGWGRGGQPYPNNLDKQKKGYF